MAKFAQRKRILLLTTVLFIVIVFCYTVAWPNNKQNPLILLYRVLEDKFDTNPDLPMSSWGSCDSFKGRSMVEQSPPYTDDLGIFRDTTPFVGEIEEDLGKIQKSDEIKRLRQSLEVIKGKTVLVIFTDREYMTIYLNWLAHLVVQLDGINLLEQHLLIALDAESCQFCNKIPIITCFCIDAVNFLSNLKLKNPSMSRRFSSEIWIIRMDLIWLMSYWGYDLFLMDTDAIPNSVHFLEYFTEFRDDQLVASLGGFPGNIVRQWGRTICMGVILIRSLRDSDGICSLFKALRHSVVGDDQIAYNIALYSMNFTFQVKNSNKDILNVDLKLSDDVYHYLHGVSATGQLRMTILPDSVVCRANCTYFSSSSELMAFHPAKPISAHEIREVISKMGRVKIPGPSDIKINAMREFDIWYLRPGIEKFFRDFDGDWKDPKQTLTLFLIDE